MDEAAGCDLLMDEFLRTMQSYFTKGMMHYNLHLFSHCLTVRKQYGSLSRVSAYLAESMYGNFTARYESGTVSIAKQGIQNILLSKKAGHMCHSSLKIDEGGQHQRQDNVVYLRDQSIHRIVDIDGDEVTLQEIDG